MSYGFQWTFGPVVIALDGSEELTAKCITKGFSCKGYIGGRCAWEKMDLPADNVTPDACPYKAGALKDAREMQGRGQ